MNSRSEVPITAGSSSAARMVGGLYRPIRVIVACLELEPGVLDPPFPRRASTHSIHLCVAGQGAGSVVVGEVDPRDQAVPATLAAEDPRVPM